MLLNSKRRARKLWRRISAPIQRLLRKEILVIGDSHAKIFSHQSMRNGLSSFFFNVTSVGGATVSGLQNPNSKTQALPIFEKSISSSKADTIIVLLGEVDTGFVIWHRAERHNAPIEEMLDIALTNYQNLLASMLQTKRNVICISAPLPTIRDGEFLGDVANARKEIKASQLERTNITILFNKRIEEFCKNHRIPYINLDSKSLGQDGLVDMRLLNKNPTDHHYDLQKYAEMLIPEIKKFMEQRPGTDQFS